MKFQMGACLKGTPFRSEFRAFYGNEIVQLCVGKCESHLKVLEELEEYCKAEVGALHLKGVPLGVAAAIGTLPAKGKPHAHAAAAVERQAGKGGTPGRCSSSGFLAEGGQRGMKNNRRGGKQ